LFPKINILRIENGGINPKKIITQSYTEESQRDTEVLLCGTPSFLCGTL
jgi:hypothetical protein